MNSADEQVFTPDFDGATSASDTDNSVILMYHGTLTRIYGLDIALEALGVVEERRPDLDIRFHVLGSGPELESLVQQSQKLGLEDRVKFLGRVPLDEVPSHLARCSAGLLPTRRDVFLDLSFSNKLVEYVVMGKPVITARLQGYLRYFREDSLIFFEPGDARSLADAIIRAVTAQDQWPHLVGSALEDYEAIRWQVMADRYAGVVEDLLRG
jgi:glycosyltransferase involved in cell wall biosynthesis